MPFDQTPISARDIMQCSEQQVGHRDADLFVRGLSPGYPISGVCLIARERALGERYHHAALPRETARRLAKQLAASQGRFVLANEAMLRDLLTRTDGLREIGDTFVRCQLGRALDALLGLSAMAEAAE